MTNGQSAGARAAAAWHKQARRVLDGEWSKIMDATEAFPGAAAKRQVCCLMPVNPCQHEAERYQTSGHWPWRDPCWTAEHEQLRQCERHRRIAVALAIACAVCAVILGTVAAMLVYRMTAGHV